MLKKLIYRNVTLYFRDKTSVFFSMLSVLIVILLYVLFLANVQVVSISEQIGGNVNKNDIGFLINTWILAGLLSITTITTTLGALGFMVSDKENKILKDFKSSPLSFSTYPLAAIISSIIVGFIISVLAFIIYTVYIYINNNYLLSLSIIIKTLGLILISTTMASGLMGLIVSFITSNSAFSSISLLIGTTIGFVNGLYIAIGQLPKTIQTFIKVLPFSHIAAIFRQVLMKDSIPIAFKNAPEVVIETYKEMFGVVLLSSNKVISINTSLSFIISVFIISILLFFINFRRKRDVI